MSNETTEVPPHLRSFRDSGEAVFSDLSAHDGVGDNASNLQMVGDLSS